MNGLLAIYKKKVARELSLSELIDRGLDTLKHRGGKWRKSILLNDEGDITESENTADLAISSCSPTENNSPYAAHNGNYIFFDGRLTNKDELCKLCKVGKMTDAELALKVLCGMDEAGFSMLYGFWSIIYYNAEKNRLYGARDHFGARTLFYCDSRKSFAIANESRTLHTLFYDVRSVNKDTVVDFLLFGNIGSLDQYFFNDIHSVEPSHYVCYDLNENRISVKRYYTLPYSRENKTFDGAILPKYLEDIRLCIADSVHKNMSLFEGPLAIGVSGGVDSSSLICTAKKIDPQRQFIAYTTTDKYDGGEVRWAEKVVKHVGAEWVKVVCTADDIIEKLYDVNRIHNVPLYNASSLAQYRIMEEIVKQGSAVFIDGQGGDEMLGGYQVYFPLALKTLRNRGAFGAWWHELSNVKNSGMTVTEMFVRRLKLMGKSLYYNPLRFAKSQRRFEYESLLPAARDKYFADPSPIPFVDKKILNDALFESYTIFLGNILRWGEHSAASHGLECVMPLSDYPPLAELVFSIPSVYKIHDGWNKYLLRKSMVGTVPDEICWRRQKLGFYIPEQNWLNEMGKAMSDTIRRLDDPEECIDKKYVLENMNRLYSSQNPLYQRFVFRCYSYLLWRNGLNG
jgi:asparagine synthase (glutamine-hydrolysing)